jgi:hypothetical protein
LSVVGLIGLVLVLAGPQILKSGRHRRAFRKTGATPAP